VISRIAASLRTPGTALPGAQIAPTSATRAPVAAEVAPRADESAARPEAGGEDGQAAAGLVPDLRQHPALVGAGIRRVVVLPGAEPAGLAAALAREIDPADLSLGVSHEARLDAAKPQQIDLPRRDVPRHDRDDSRDPVLRRDDSERERRVAGRVLDDRLHAVEAAVPARLEEHVDRGERFHVEQRQEVHQLAEDANSLRAQRIEGFRQLHEGKGRVLPRIEEIANRGGALEDGGSGAGGGPNVFGRHGEHSAPSLPIRLSDGCTGGGRPKFRPDVPDAPPRRDERRPSNIRAGSRRAGRASAPRRISSR
jgi:hypothetical protein